MNVLEKILEEISEVEKEYVTGHKLLYALGATGMAIEISRIIHSHMDEAKDINVPSNVGWIPVEERLPDEKEFQRAYCKNYYAAEFIVMIENATIPTTLYFKNESWFDEERNYYKVIAWRPLPKPYKPKKDIPATEHIMSRFTKVE